MELLHNGGSINITDSDLTSQTSSSELRASETQSGGYMYNCSVRIRGGQPFSAVASVNVRGM